jgi:hypothetical protein
MKTRRRLLGTNATFGGRIRMYLADDAIEVDEMEGYVGARKRVLFDEVLLLTYDQRRRWATVIGMTVLVLVFAGTGLIVALVGGRAAPIGVYLTISTLAMLFLSILVYQLGSGSNCITVFGKRTTAQAFVFGRRRAQATFDVLRDRIAGSQERERQRIAKASAHPAGPSAQ